MKYIRVGVLTNLEHGDTTNYGISVTHRKHLLVEHENGYIDESDVENAEDDFIILELVKRDINGKEYLHFKQKGETRWVMFGGNYANCSDSRFKELNRYPIPIHDRIE